MAGNITVGNSDSILAENNLRFKSSGAAYIDHNTTGQAINFRTSNSSALDTAAMTIDSSGNLLVGTTDSAAGVGNTNTGIALGSNNAGVFSRTGTAGQATAYFNKNTNDGDIIKFNKDGTTVGSIGAESSGLLIGSGNVGIRFIDSGQDRIIPRKTTRSNADNLIDLGDSGSRFKDLYVSGTASVGHVIPNTQGTYSINHLGVYSSGITVNAATGQTGYLMSAGTGIVAFSPSGGSIKLGGTAAANQLDDYEEGTWTPALGNITTNSISVYGIYTKIGNLVHIHAKITATVASLPGATWKITGLPFTATNSSDTGQREIIAIGGDCSNLGSLANGRASFRTDGAELQGVYLNSGTTAYWTYNTMDHTTFELHLSGTYRV